MGFNFLLFLSLDRFVVGWGASERITQPRKETMQYKLLKLYLELESLSQEGLEVKGKYQCLQFTSFTEFLDMQLRLLSLLSGLPLTHHRGAMPRLAVQGCTRTAYTHA